MTTPRRVREVRTLPPPARGQFGPHHQAIEVIRPQEWTSADPFILLMDDRADGLLEAGPHPHAGFETVTFVVDGSIGAETQGGGALSAGDVEWTTAGSGIVHGPETPIDGKMRVLQLWLTLPRADRWTDPDHQVIRRDEALVRREPGVELRLYSGRSADLVSPTRNRVPVILADVTLQPGAHLAQEIPAAHTGFLYVLDGSLDAGGAKIREGQIAWLEKAEGDAPTALEFANKGERPARVLLYTGQRQDISISWYGPFIGDTQQDIVRSFERYRAGTFQRV